MRINDYEFMNPQDTAAGDQLTRLGRAHPLAAERAVRALEKFAGTDTGLACKVIEAGDVEVYLVPPRWVLVHIPDSAALIRVNHASKQIDIVEILEDYGGIDEPAQWEQAKELALAAM
jgi:hypothetical protein